MTGTIWLGFMRWGTPMASRPARTLATARWWRARSIWLDLRWLIEAAAPAASAIVAFSFMVYNAAKVLLALALIVIGLDRGKALGGLSALIGLVAFVSNTLSMALGRGFSGELPIAGGSGVLATILLAVCLFGLSDDEA